MMRSPSRVTRRRKTPWVEGCWGPILTTYGGVLSSDIGLVPGEDRSVEAAHPYLSAPPLKKQRNQLRGETPRAPSVWAAPLLTLLTSSESWEVLPYPRLKPGA